MLRRRLSTLAAKGNVSASGDELRPLGAVYRFSRAHLPAHMPSDDVSRLTARPLIVFPSNHTHSDTQQQQQQRVSSKTAADDAIYGDVRARESSTKAEKKKKLLTFVICFRVIESSC